MADPKIQRSENEQRKGMGAFTLIAILILAIGLLFTFSLSNYNTYTFRKNSQNLTLWKGKLSPKAYEIVESFEPLEVGDAEVGSLTERSFIGKDTAYRAFFSYLLDEIGLELTKGDGASMDKINRLLERAESILETRAKDGGSLAGPRLQLAKMRVAFGQMTLTDAYQKAVPAYEEALSKGLGNSIELQTELEQMKIFLKRTALEKTGEK
jgi:hypothetical protein